MTLVNSNHGGTRSGFLNRGLTLTTLIFTLVYLIFCAMQAFGITNGAGQNVDTILPRTLVLLAFGAAVMTLAFLPEIGKILAAVSLLGVFGFFWYWWSITSAIKVNLGMDHIPSAGPLGNVFVGAQIWDLLMLAGAVILLAWDLVALRKNFVRRFRPTRRVDMSQVVAHKS